MMRYSFLIAVGFWLLASPCFATTQILLSGDNTDVASASARQITFLSALNSAYAARTATSRSSIIAAAGTLTNLRARVNTAPGGSDSVVITLYVDGSASTSTCTITGTATTCADTSNSVAVTAGQTLLYDVDYTATATTAPMQWSMVFTPTTSDYTVLSGGSGGNNMANTDWAPLGGIAVGGSASEPPGRFVAAGAGTVRDFYCAAGVAPGAGNSFIYTLRVNGSNTSVVCTIADTNTSSSDTTNTAAIVAGDLVTWDLTYGGTPVDRNHRTGLVFIPTTTGDALTGGSGGTASSTSATNYITTAGFVATSATEATFQSLGQATATITAIEGEALTAPGVGKSYLLTLRQDTGSGFADTALTCTLTGASAGVCNGTGSITVNNGDMFTVSVAPSGTPTASIIHVGLLVSTATTAARRVILISQEDSCGSLWPFFCSSRN